MTIPMIVLPSLFMLNIICFLIVHYWGKSFDALSKRNEELEAENQQLRNTVNFYNRTL